MTRQLLAFSRKQVSGPVILDLNQAVENASRMLRRLVGDDVVLRVSMDPELAHVRIDPSQLVQVLMNLALNARDAMHRGGTLRIETRAAAGAVMLAVSDTGSGMSDEVKQRMFEPFFTTKDVGRGTGLGLPVVLGVVQQAGGKIAVETTLGVGTTFRIHLPAVADPLTPVLAVEEAATHGSERVLLVDDDAYLRSAAARGLRGRGYTVLEAQDGITALGMLDADTAIELLITDVVMPGIDGRELVERARVRRPTLRVLYTSGYLEDEVVKRGILSAEVAFLEKPFRIHTLAGKVRQVLDEVPHVEVADAGA
jgi:CheY-like chemotaxis protein